VAKLKRTAEMRFVSVRRGCPACPPTSSNGKRPCARRSSSDDSLAAVFAKIAELLRIVGVIAVKAKLYSTNLSESLDLIKGMVEEAA